MSFRKRLLGALELSVHLNFDVLELLVGQPIGVSQ
jgi:hypothetical protein